MTRAMSWSNSRPATPTCALSKIRRRMDLGWPCAPVWRIFAGMPLPSLMADGSDDPADLVKYHAKLQDGYDCVFGSRFIAGSKLIDYPIHKLIINRLANLFISALFQLRYNDFTNAFKCYRRSVIAGLEPILAHHFNLTVELPLKAIIRGYSFAVIPISWTNRTSGVSKLKIREMGSRYLFIVLYCFIERLLSRGDYRRKPGKLVPQISEHPYKDDRLRLISSAKAWRLAFRQLDAGCVSPRLGLSADRGSFIGQD